MDLLFLLYSANYKIYLNKYIAQKANNKNLNMINGYSYLNIFTGLEFAAFILWKLIVKTEINNATIAARI
jgi:hypothetical protein